MEYSRVTASEISRRVPRSIGHIGGESHTGVTVMRTELALDTGDMLLVKRCEIGNLTCGELSAKLSALGADATLEAVELLEKGEPRLLMQDDAVATYCTKIKKRGREARFFGYAPTYVPFNKSF